MLLKKEGAKKSLVCSNKKCNYKSKDTSMAKITEKVKQTEKDVEVIDKGELETLPVTDGKCDKCGNDRAYYWLVQTRAGDEPETKFLKCQKCEHTWRDYS